MDDLNEVETAILIYMYNNMEDVIRLSNGFLSVGGDDFDTNDLYRLYDKLGLSDLIN